MELYPFVSKNSLIDEPWHHMRCLTKVVRVGITKNIYYSVNTKYFSVNTKHFSVNTKHFSVNTKHFSVITKYLSVLNKYFRTKHQVQ